MKTKYFKFLPLLFMAFLTIFSCEEKDLPDPKACYTILDTNNQTPANNTLVVKKKYKLVNCGLGTHFSFWSGETRKSYQLYLQEVADTSIKVYKNFGNKIVSDTTELVYSKVGIYQATMIAVNSAYYEDELKTDTISMVINVIDATE